MILHLVNKSPFGHQCLKDCLAVMSEGDALLLLEDGVYGALGNIATDIMDQLNGYAEKGNLFALAADVESRGLKALLPGTQIIDDKAFVKLTIQYPLSQSWF